MSGRKTGVLTFNLYNRGYKYNGTDRSNVNMKGMIALINSPKTQELVKNGVMVGYFGHEIRKRYGMQPPESQVIDGKVVMLEPAFKTIMLEADADGTVRHQAEFATNSAGKFAQRQYESKMGGFSTSVDYISTGVGLEPFVFYGFDYVIQPNFASNKGDGQLFDGLFIPHENAITVSCFDSMTNIDELNQDQIVIAKLLDQQIVSIYDSMALNNENELLLEQLAQTNNELIKLQRKRELQEQRQKDLFTGMVGKVSSFDDLCTQADQYLKDLDQQSQNSKKQKSDPFAEKLMKVVGKIGGGF